MADKPNILIIWGDDIGISNLSCYSDGMMGYADVTVMPTGGVSCLVGPGTGLRLSA
jgi:arylsulfatase A-like enzyme